MSEEKFDAVRQQIDSEALAFLFEMNRKLLVHELEDCERFKLPVRTEYIDLPNGARMAFGRWGYHPFDPLSQQGVPVTRQDRLASSREFSREWIKCWQKVAGTAREIGALEDLRSFLPQTPIESAMHDLFGRVVEEIELEGVVADLVALREACGDDLRSPEPSKFRMPTFLPVQDLESRIRPPSSAAGYFGSLRRWARTRLKHADGSPAEDAPSDGTVQHDVQATPGGSAPVAEAASTTALPSIVRKSRPPLSDHARALFRILGRVPEMEGRTAAQLVSEMSAERITVDDDRVRRLVKELRDKGYPVRHSRATGYFVRESPEGDMSSDDDPACT